MPFVKPERRWSIQKGLLTEWEPGDRCYVFYKKMVEKWKAIPRWTTAHAIYKELMLRRESAWGIDDDVIACELAWQVFFNLHVMPYELKKREENGDI